MPTQRPFSLNGETIVLDDQVRSSAPGKFINLPDGKTYYEQEGPVDGAPVVFINGFSIPVYLWDHNFLPLAQAGFRTLRFDLFGRGYSDRPNIHYGPDLFVRQLKNLLDALKIKTPVHLIGSSMGGIIAAIFTDRHPDLVKKLILIDPAGMMDPPSLPASALSTPIMGELILNLFGNQLLLPGMKKDLLNPEAFPEYLTKYMPQMKIKGFKRAILSTLRSGMLYHQHDVYLRVGQQERPILLLWGKEDQTIPLSTGKQVKEHLPQAVFQIIDQVGHVPHYELPDLVNPILIDFLKN
jgi:pimeloyl-ACP methyl ester carboxylesterase